MQVEAWREWAFCTKASDHLSALHQISLRSKSSSSALQNRTTASISKQTTLQRRNSTCLKQIQLQQMVQTKLNRKIIYAAEGEEVHCGKKETHRKGGGTRENAHFCHFVSLCGTQQTIFSTMVIESPVILVNSHTSVWSHTTGALILDEGGTMLSRKKITVLRS
jgi:hypothetical protein